MQNSRYGFGILQNIMVFYLKVLCICIFIISCKFYFVYAVDDSSPESHPNYDVTLHQNWKLVNSADCGASASDRIIGGVNASLGSYPWIARIGYSGSGLKSVQFRCGGSLISEWYVVTAAHCVTNLPNGMELTTIRLGEHDTETDVDCDKNMCAALPQDFTPTKLIVHQEYGNPKYKNDIALIRLDRGVDMNGWVNPLCLPYGELLTTDLVAKLGEVAGWGIYDLANPQPSRFLQYVKLPIVRLEQCMEHFKHHATLDARQMCVGGRVGRDSCGGDSGGPLMKVEAVDGPPKYFFIGVVSFGAKHCGKTAMPAVYTRISAYVDWILDNMLPL